MAPTLTAVLVGEKEMNLSPCCPPPSPQQNFELDTNVKWVKTGRRKTEGWARKVFRISRCQQESRPTRKPGRRKVETAIAAPPPRSGAHGPSSATALARASPLPTSVKPQAKN